MRIHIDKQLLHCVKENGIFPQGVQHSPTIDIEFFADVMVVTRHYPCKDKVAHIKNWRGKTAPQICMELRRY